MQNLKTASDGEMNIRRILNSAGKKSFIPAGRMPNIRPNFPAEASRLANKRDKIRAANPADHRLQELGKELNKLVAKHNSYGHEEIMANHKESDQSTQKRISSYQLR